MAKANRAISLGVSAIVVIALILIVGFGLFINATFNTTGTTTSNPGTIYIGSTNTSSLTSTVKTLSNGNVVTVTEYVIISGYASYTMEISGTCTLGGGTLIQYPTFTTTSFFTPTNVTGTATTTTTVHSGNATTSIFTTTLTKTTSTSACPTVA